MRRNSCMDAVADELRSAGIRYTVERRRRHHKVRFTLHGQHHTLTIGVTPSRTAWVSARADVRRILRIEAVP
jgi:hypothetical protein